MSWVYLLDINTILEPLKTIPDWQVIENIERNYPKIAIAWLVISGLWVGRGVQLLPDLKKRLKTLDYIDTVLSKFPILPNCETSAKWYGLEVARL